MIDELLLVHPDPEARDAFRRRFAGLAGVKVMQCRFEDLPAHDCFVTAGNSYGIMTAGIDAVVVERFGEPLMKRVQDHILADYFGEQPVGTAFLIPTGDTGLPFVCHAPTMRVPGDITGTDRVYAATWAALLATAAHTAAGRDPIRVLAMPAMGTGFGRVPFDEAARQMAAAYRHYLDPPHQLDWDVVTARHLAISYDGGKRVVG